jgi:hypothetical protein
MQYRYKYVINYDHTIIAQHYMAYSCPYPFLIGFAHSRKNLWTTLVPRCAQTSNHHKTARPGLTLGGSRC